MLENSLVGRRFLTTGIACLCLLAAHVYQPKSSFVTDPEVPMPFIAGSTEEFLDQIFVEEKSNRICRFIKIKKMKA